MSASTRKRIAFIDANIDNWHANVFAKFLANSPSGYTLSAVYALEKSNLAAWAAERNVVVAETIADLADHADYLMVLAPSNPELHLDLCRQAFALGKTTYVDKTFAPDAATAREIFALADQHGIAVQTSSVLRYTEAQNHCSNRPPLALSTWAGGGNFNEYLIHPLEHVISLMGHEITSAERRENALGTEISLHFSGNRVATIHFYPKHGTPFFTVISDAQATTPVTIDGNLLFENGLLGILDFFTAGKPLISREETMAIMELRDRFAQPE